MTTRKFNLGRTGELKARFHQANGNLATAAQQVRDLAAQLEAELYLARLFGAGRGVRPQ